MKGTSFICLLLMLILVLMGAQTYMLWQKTQALEVSLTCALDDLSAMKDSVRTIAEAGETLNGIWSRLTQESSLLSFLGRP